VSSGQAANRRAAATLCFGASWRQGKVDADLEDANCGHGETQMPAATTRLLRPQDLAVENGYGNEFVQQSQLESI